MQNLGVDYIREKLNFYNRRDFRVETAINLLKRWNYLSENQEGFQILEEPESWPDPQIFEKKEKHQLIHLQKMLEYVKSSECRTKVIGQYFGEPEMASCGICDNCDVH